MILLDDLLKSASFSDSVRDLAREFRQVHGLPKIGQLGLLASEVEDAARYLERTHGVGPFLIAEGKPVLWRERGEHREFKGQLGFAGFKGFELELLEPGVGSDFYRDAIDRESRIVVHHLGFFVKDVDDAAHKLELAGYRLWVRGRLRVAVVTSDFAYMDTTDAAGVIVEFISWRILGIPFKPPFFLYHALGTLQKILGIRSFRA